MKVLAKLALIASTLLAGPAAAQQENQSAYTDVNLDECSVMQSDDFGTSWACPGYKGYPLYIAEGDLRFFVSYGFGAPDEPAAGQTLPPFNTLGPRIEWRMSNESGAWRPFATILRFILDKSDVTPEGGEVLVVTRLEAGKTCHTAYIDAKANAEANELAREAADEDAAAFDCADEPEYVGDFEAWER